MSVSGKVTRVEVQIVEYKSIKQIAYMYNNSSVKFYHGLWS